MIVGIDPGQKTGVAIYRDGVLVELRTIAPVEIQRELGALSPGLVVFEDSRLQSHTWTSGASRAAAAKMARNVGQIDAWCQLIEAHCRGMGIDARGVSPRDKGGKVGAAQFKCMTGWNGPSNEHTRDAAMVALPFRRAVVREVQD